LAWDTATYTKQFSFVPQYGTAMVDMITHKSGSSLLDLGCGEGSLSAILHSKGFLVTGLDASEEMLAAARKNHPGIPFIQGDATAFHPSHPYDVVFSNAVLHWIPQEKQMDLLRCVASALHPGGEFIFEMGGHGNNALIHAEMEKLFTQYGKRYRFPFFFPTIGEYTPMMEKAGFTVTDAFLFDRPTKLIGSDGLSEWIRMFIRSPFEGMEEKEHREIIEEAVEELKPSLLKDGVWYSDYVRLRIRAVIL
jgi:trans-aconitate methyltransferase